MYSKPISGSSTQYYWYTTANSIPDDTSLSLVNGATMVTLAANAYTEVDISNYTYVSLYQFTGNNDCGHIPTLEFY